jgi:glycosyltransferase involved in cell wall biosynthesis
MTQKPKIALAFPIGPRSERLAAAAQRGMAPREFFYGYFDLLERGFDVALMDTRADPRGLCANIALNWEILRNRYMSRGFSVQRVAAVASELAAADIVISVTDSFSISLGLHAPKLKDRPILIGGFMGLADLPAAVPRVARAYFTRRIREALANLDHIYFLGTADRDASCARFAIDPAKVSTLPFGVDTEFWSPGPETTNASPFIVAVGSDINRDYATLIEAPLAAPLRIVTRLPVRVPRGRDIEILQGNLTGSAISDEQLRELYRSATAVVVPLHDVFQPSGQSVTLQAMACGTPVVLTRTRGLWDTEIKSGKNCLLVAPNAPDETAEAVNKLLSDVDLRTRLSAEARATAESRFSLTPMEAGIRALIENAALPARH